ncbi:hypothetical protein HGRIS_011908 [Hohenbuehelia grisea]|uniref:DUF6593 domain-containing protein n=1 Tax=Hohenbuehelia grisea TaxID=104357 RepID=A0ABR3JYL1_9AGAR
MYTNNPYAQWQQGNKSAFPSAGASVYGALPFSSSSSKPAIIAFYFDLNPTLFNCVVTGPDNKTLYTIATDSPSPGFTIMADAHGKALVVVEWQSHPIVEVRGVVQKQHAARFLALSSDKNARHMEFRGKRYTWAPGTHALCLFNSAVNPPELLAQVTSGSRRIVMEMSSYAIQAGLTEVCVLSTFLLLCGRNID